MSEWNSRRSALARWFVRARRAAFAFCVVLCGLSAAPTAQPLATALAPAPEPTREPAGQAAESRPAAGVARELGSSPWRWRRISVAGVGDPGSLSAVAIERAPGTAAPGHAAAAGGRVAVGDIDGVSLGEGVGGFRRAARVEGVTDLGFTPDGTLWIGSLSGLWRLSVEGRLSDRSPAPGEAARLVNRLAVRAGLLAVGSEAGAFVSADGERWRRLGDGLPSGSVGALALARGPASTAGPAIGLPADGSRDAWVEIWLVIAGDLWRIEAVPDATSPGGVALGSAERIQLPGAPKGIPAVDVSTDLPGASVAVLYPGLLVARHEGRDDESSARHEVLRPVLPPGAHARRIAAGAGGVWIATDAGLLFAPGLAGPWRRAGGAAGSAATRAIAVAPGGETVIAAGEQGLLLGSPVLRADAASAPRTQPSARVLERAEKRVVDPDIRAVHRAGLRYLALEPERMRDLRRGVARRGWLPEMSVQFEAAKDHGRSSDWDQSFVSGDTRNLFDRDEDRSRGLGASLVLSWDLGDIAFNEDSIDVSREARLVISLRDGVLDEINQLYFERRGLLEKLSMPIEVDEPVRIALELRAAELAAGLDGWTGGWFSGAVSTPTRAALPLTHPGPFELQEKPSTP